jgi:hypothetical protein
MSLHQQQINQGTHYLYSNVIFFFSRETPLLTLQLPRKTELCVHDQDEDILLRFHDHCVHGDNPVALSIHCHLSNHHRFGWDERVFNAVGLCDIVLFAAVERGGF